MNIARFISKCLTKPAEARDSALLVLRSFYGRVHWKFFPNTPIEYQFPEGGRIQLPLGHSFTHCFWPAIERYEPEVRFALQDYLRPGSTFIDCGANIGCWSVMASGLVGKEGRVISIEANPVTLQLLQKNLDANGLPKAVHGALTSTSGDLQLYVPKSGFDIFSTIRPGGIVEDDDSVSITVAGMTLDSVVESSHLDRVDLIKIDVEGAEMDVLRSAIQTLKKFRPTVVLEYGTVTWPVFGSKPEDLRSFAESLGYQCQVYDLPGRRLRDVKATDWESTYTNIILSPV